MAIKGKRSKEELRKLGEEAMKNGKPATICPESKKRLPSKRVKYGGYVSRIMGSVY